MSLLARSVWLVAPLAWTACAAGLNVSTKERASLAIREYVEGIRWGRLPDAAQYLDEERKARLFDQGKLLEEELEIADAEVVAMQIDRQDPKRTKIIARVDYVWSLKRRGIVEKTTTRQVWTDHGISFQLLEETRIGGSPLTLFDEPVRRAGEATRPLKSALEGATRSVR
jgi:hypothetical protein